MALPLPLADTPRIAKNRRMRDSLHSRQSLARRRSSILQRGKRMSSAGSRFTGHPHDSIPTDEYYRLIDAEQSDPVRMRQLLVWCAQKAMDAIPNKLSASKGSVDLIVRDIQKEIIAGLHAKQINVSWYHRPADEDEVSRDTEASLSSTATATSATTTASGKLPHPSNVQLACNVSSFKDQIARYTAEADDWQTVLAHHTRDHAILRSAIDAHTVISYDVADLSPYLLPDFVSTVHRSALSADLEAFAADMHRDHVHAHAGCV
ncbi:Mis12-Mtw1 protein family-domain-containing protein [Entophlyctis helioformis]|nr:Mis12-Mtw1 protein family-domain-containing protein [Entophlyctis helioformis]